MAFAELGAPALFMAGLAASPHCSLMCGPLQFAQLQGRGAVLPAAAWLHAGRVFGYAVLGALAGAAGARLQHALPPLQAGVWLQSAAALLMLVLGLRLLRALPPGACGKRLCISGRRQALLRGVAWALLPCGMLYAMLLLAALSAQARSGALLMAAFGLGTVPLSLGSALALRQLSLSPPRLRRWAAGALMTVGALSLVAIAKAADIGGWCRAAIA
jgi:uncharacterized protein